MEKSRVRGMGRWFWSCRVLLIRTHLSRNEKEVKGWTTRMSGGKARAKTRSQEQAWCVASSSKKATVGTVERAKAEQ